MASWESGSRGELKYLGISVTVSGTEEMTGDLDYFGGQLTLSRARAQVLGDRSVSTCFWGWFQRLLGEWPQPRPPPAVAEIRTLLGLRTHRKSDKARRLRGDSSRLPGP